MYNIYRINRENNKLFIKNGKNNSTKLQIVLEFNKNWKFKDFQGNIKIGKSADVFITDGKKKVLYWDAEDGNPDGMNFGCFHLDDMMYDERIRDAVKVFRRKK